MAGARFHIEACVASARLSRLARSGLGLRDPISQEMARRLSEALAPVRLAEKSGRALELGCGLAPAAPLLDMSEPPVRLDLVDWPEAEPAVIADVTALPFSDSSFDLVWANNVMPWIGNLPGMLSESRRVLQEGGLLAATSLGPDTLCELAELLPGAPMRTLGFLDMHDLADMTMHAGFAEPVAATEKIELVYSSARAMLSELRRYGVLAASGMEVSLGSTSRMRSLLARPGAVGLTFEVIYLHAWAMPARTPKGAADWHEISFLPSGS